MSAWLSTTAARQCARRWPRPAANCCDGPLPRLSRPWGNRIEVVGYDNIQFTKAPNVLRGMGLALDKNESARRELAEKGMAADVALGGPCDRMSTPLLFQPITFRSVTARNRIVVAPMCQYSATDGLGDDWHVQHLGARAMGGAGIVFTEATTSLAIGRITHHCLGLWTAQHQALLTRLAAIISRGGAVPGIQLAHAGRKASTTRTWEGSKPIAPGDGGWVPWRPARSHSPERGRSARADRGRDRRHRRPSSRNAARMAREAGCKVVEMHAAHGYLLHSFLSPISNHRNDGYGGDLEGRSRFLMETLDAVRAEWPGDLPLFVRLSCADYLARRPDGRADTVTLCLGSPRAATST